MKINLSLMLFILVPAIFYAADISTGSYLYINPLQPSRIVIDGEEVGISPILLTDISRNNHKLQIFGDSLYSEFSLNFDRNKKQITRISPEGIPYYGFLQITSITEGSTLLLNGEELPSATEERLTLPEGEHQVSISKEGYFSKNVLININRLETLSFGIELEQIYRVFLPEELPEGSRILCSKEDVVQEHIFDGQSPLLLEQGQWEFHISHPLFEEVALSITLEKTETSLELDLQYFQPYITLLGIKKGSRIILNDQVIEAEEDEESLELPARGGENLLLIHRDGYLDLTEEISLEGNQILDIDLEFAKDPQVISAGRRSTGWIMIGTGLAMLSGGIILNQDDILLSTTSNYEQYSNMKYASLGLAGSGILSFLTGSGFLGMSLKEEDS